MFLMPSRANVSGNVVDFACERTVMADQSARICSSARTRCAPAKDALDVAGIPVAPGLRARHCYLQPDHRYFCEFNWRTGSRQ